jgi:hypothetical protein
MQYILYIFQDDEGFNFKCWMHADEITLSMSFNFQWADGNSQWTIGNMVLIYFSWLFVTVIKFVARHLGAKSVYDRFHCTVCSSAISSA